MKRILVLLLFIINCASFDNKMTNEEIDKIQNEVTIDITSCESLKGLDKRGCYDNLALEYIKTVSSSTEIVRREKVYETKDAVKILYTLKKHKIIIKFTVTDNTESTLEAAKRNGGWFTAGTVFGIILMVLAGG